MWKQIKTNLSLLAFKRWHEQVAQQMAVAKTINATEGGILGVEQDGKESTHMEFMTLKEAVEGLTNVAPRTADPRELVLA